MRVIHLPRNVGGNPQGLSVQLNKLGVKSETWVFLQDTVFGYSADKVICHARHGIFIRELKRILALNYIFRTDIVFFNFGSGLFRPFPPRILENHSRWKILAIRIYDFYSKIMATIELMLLDLMKVPIFIQYQGDDARQGDFCRANFPITFANTVPRSYYNEQSDSANRRSIVFFAKKTTKIYALNPDLLHILPKTAEFLPYSNIDLEEWVPAFTQLEARPLRIGHAPSNRAVKGTDLILDAVNNLKLAGFEFELVLVEGLSNAEAKEVYKSVDLVIDQVFAGWYGGLAVEAMALGKPVVAYIRSEDLHFIPSQMREDLPIIRVEPSTIREVLESILIMPRAELLEKARRSRAYVEKWHDPIAIAQRVKIDMELALNYKS